MHTDDLPSFTDKYWEKKKASFIGFILLSLMEGLIFLKPLVTMSGINM